MKSLLIIFTLSLTLYSFFALVMYATQRKHIYFPEQATTTLTGPLCTGRLWPDSLLEWLHHFPQHVKPTQPASYRLDKAR